MSEIPRSDGRQLDKDFVKGILMFLVVWGHVCPDSAGNYYDNQWNGVSRITALFVMPLFFILSGYFQKPIQSFTGIWIRVKKLLLRIGAPLLCWGVISIVFHPSGIVLRGADLLWSIKNCIYYICNYLWYLPCLFICTFISLMPNYIRSRYPHYALGSSVFLILLLNFSSIDFFHVRFMYPFYVLGLFLQQYNDTFKKVFSIPFINIVLLFASIFIIIDGGLTPSETFYCKQWNHEIDEFGDMLGRWLFYFVSTLCAYHWLIKLHGCFAGLKIRDYIERIGRDSLFLYAGHMTFLSCVYKPLVEYFTSGMGLFPLHPMFLYYVYAPIVAILIIWGLLSLRNSIKKAPFWNILLCGDSLR